MIVKPYPKDNEWRRMGLRPAPLDQLRDPIGENDLGPDDLLFATREGTPISRNTFRTRAWKPAVKASGLGFNVRIHVLRPAHASWLLAGGADLKSVMDRMGHTQIQTTQKYLHVLAFRALLRVLVPEAAPPASPGMSCIACLIARSLIPGPRARAGS